jgi:hypothetical protein
VPITRHTTVRVLALARTASTALTSTAARLLGLAVRGTSRAKVVRFTRAGTVVPIAGTAHAVVGGAAHVAHHTVVVGLTHASTVGLVALTTLARVVAAVRVTRRTVVGLLALAHARGVVARAVNARSALYVLTPVTVVALITRTSSIHRATADIGAGSGASAEQRTVIQIVVGVALTGAVDETLTVTAAS